MGALALPIRPSTSFARIEELQMANMDDTSDVLIVGAGPAGLMLAYDFNPLNSCNQD